MAEIARSVLRASNPIARLQEEHPQLVEQTR